MNARLTLYRAPPDAVEPLIDEIVALARAGSRWSVERASRRAEFFFINTSSGDGLSLLLGDDLAVAPVVELARPAAGDPEEYEVHLFQVGGPETSGVVEALFGRVVRCDPGEVSELSFDGDAVLRSTAVWARALLVAPSGRVVAFAVASDHTALEDSLIKFSPRCARLDDYDGVAYHFFVNADYERSGRDP
jgi:hypothetical protein